MRPCTHHYVVTLEDYITYGRHFYSAATLSDTVYGVIHSFVTGVGATNTLHDNITRTLLHRMMAMCHYYYLQDHDSSVLFILSFVVCIITLTHDRC